MHPHPLLLLVVLMTASFFFSADALVETCKTCREEGDGSKCANGDYLTSTNCNSPDWKNTFCQVTRNAGVWERGCCIGVTNCKDVHETDKDGGTTDVKNCNSDDCNIMDPRTQTSDDGVEACMKCTGSNDGTDCAKGDKLKSESCGRPDFDNTWCRVKRAGGVWTRDCCFGVSNCKNDQSTDNDGSTTDILHCHSNDCNIMDPRGANADEGVETCIQCSGENDGTACAKGDSFNGQACGYDDFDNTYCQVKRAGGVWTRECCYGVKHCKDFHSTDNTGSTTDVINCHTNNCNDMDPQTYTTTTTTTTTTTHTPTGSATATATTHTPTGSGGSLTYMLNVVMMLCLLTYIM